MKRIPQSLLLAAGFAVLVAVFAGVARAEGAVVFRFGPEAGCQVGPTDIPGVPVEIPAECQVVATPSGNALVLVRGRIPAGFELSETFFSADVPCGFPGLGFGRGVLVATPSGQVTAHCHIRSQTAFADRAVGQR